MKMASVSVCLSIVQCNCQRAYAVMSDLGGMIANRCVSVALLQEPYVRDGRVVGLPASMDVIVCKSESIKAAVVVNDPSVDVICVSECTNEYGVCVWLKGDFGELVVVSMYCQYGKDIEPYLSYLERVRECIGGKRMIVGMDANAISPLWYSKGGGRGRENELRGEVLEEWIVVNDMVVLNEPSEFYTFSGPNGESDIDVTLVNEACMDCLFEWEVKCDWGISDHNVISVRMMCEQQAEVTTEICRWNAKGVNWDVYVDDLSERAMSDCMRLMDVTDVNVMVDGIMAWIRDVNDSTMGRIKRRKTRKLVWWTEELERLKRTVKRCRKAYQRARKNRMRGMEKKREYTQVLGQYKKKIWEARESSWRKHVAETGNRDPWGDVYRVCMDKRRKDRLSGMKCGDRVTDTWRESVDVLLDRFFPTPSMEVPCVNDNINSVNGKQFEWNEINGAVRSMKLGKAPGMDGVTAEMLRRIWMAIPEWMKSMYDMCLNSGCFPNEWKIARVIVLLKSLDRVRSDPGSYRPICLLPVLGKVLERMMVKRMERKVCDRMCDAQHGFVSGRSTESAWNCVIEWVNESECKYVLGVFVDFRGAFDNLEWKCVLEKLREVGCEEMDLWRSYFSERKVCMIGARESVWKEVKRGCPQGSICGPFIWNLMMDDLLWQLKRSGCKVSAYADDILLVIEGRNRVELERKGTEWMRMVCEWGESVGVSVSKEKTVMMLLKGTMARTRCPNVRMNDVCVKYVPCVKYLGVWMSERMNFKVHLEKLRGKTVSVMGKLRRVLRSEWGLRKKAVRILYKGLFSACVMYGASVWYSVMKFKYARELMNRCQRTVLCGCMNVCRTVSTEALQVLMGGLPWDLECVRRGMKYKIKNGIGMNVDDIVSQEEKNGMSVDECMDIVERRLYEKWQRRWDESVHGRVTYEFVKNVRTAEECRFVDIPLFAMYLFTGHGSMNAFLYERKLAECEECACGAGCEDWKHVLCECRLYDDIRNLHEWGVTVREDGSVDVSNVFVSKDVFESVCKYAMDAFRRRRMSVRV